MRNFFIILILFALGSGCKKDRNNPTPSPIIVTPTSWLSAKIGENFIFIADTNRTTIDTQIKFTEIFAYEIGRAHV